MSPADIIRNAQSMELVDEDGEVFALSLLPPLSDPEVDAFAESLPCPLPDDISELLRFCRGFEDVGADQVDFTGRDLDFAHEVIFPYGIPIASDGFGNFWVVDLNPDSSEFGPVYFACHDAPVILYQCKTVGELLAELFKMCVPPHKSLVDDVHEDRIRNVWSTNPEVIDYDVCVKSSDTILSAFAATLDSSWQFIDLRKAEPGDGFSWGRYGPQTNIRRCGDHPVFAYQIRRGFFGRLFGA